MRGRATGGRMGLPLVDEPDTRELQDEGRQQRREVGEHVNSTGRGERPEQVPGEAGGGEAPVPMARLRPGVRKVDVVRLDRGVGYEPADDAVCIARDDMDV